MIKGTSTREEIYAINKLKDAAKIYFEVHAKGLCATISQVHARRYTSTKNIHY